jgi:hypothetical protein
LVEKLKIIRADFTEASNDEHEFNFHTPRHLNMFRAMNCYARQTMIFLIFAATFSHDSFSQKVSKRYFIGTWQSVDSSTGLIGQIKFDRKSVTFFSKTDTSEWNYSVYDKDSMVAIKYVIYSKRATLDNEGALVILNDTCFWWFNPNDYGKYRQLLHNGYSMTHKERFETWLKGCRIFVYRRSSTLP